MLWNPGGFVSCTAQPGSQHAAPLRPELLWGYCDSRIREVWATPRLEEEIRKVRDGKRARVYLQLTIMCSTASNLKHSCECTGCRRLDVQLSPSLLALDQCLCHWTCAVTRRMTKMSPFWSQVPHCPRSLFVNVQALISMQRLSESVIMPKLTNLPETHSFVKHSPGARKESEVLQDLWVWAPCFIKAPTLTIDQLCPRNVMAVTTHGMSKPTLSCLYSLAMHQYTHTKNVQIVWAESMRALPI